MHIADMIIETYATESMLLRAEKLVSQRGEAACAAQLDMLRTYLFDAADKINISGKQVIAAMASGDEQRMMLMGLKRFTKVQSFNTKEARRRIAKQLCEANKYCF